MDGVPMLGNAKLDTGVDTGEPFWLFVTEYEGNCFFVAYAFNINESHQHTVSVKQYTPFTKKIDFEFLPDSKVILKSTTDGSTKRFAITVDDTGTLSVTEVAE